MRGLTQELAPAPLPAGWPFLAVFVVQPPLLLDLSSKIELQDSASVFIKKSVICMKKWQTKLGKVKLNEKLDKGPVSVVKVRIPGLPVGLMWASSVSSVPASEGCQQT